MSIRSITADTQPENSNGRRLANAVHQNTTFSTTGILERVFSRLFRGLVYPQIWEDPLVDMEALAIQPNDHIVAIASGGCNIMSYLTENPAAITAVDLSKAHVALNQLKLSAAENLPDHESFYRFFGRADEKANVAAYEKFIRDELDIATRAYWDRRQLNGKRRVTIFSRDLYRHGLLGWFIGAAHRVAKLYGIDPQDMLRARTIEEQRNYFETALAPLFDRRMIRWATSRKASLFGLGIPPAQYEALASSGNGDMALVLRQRLERLACDFPLSDNYFAWQAFGRSYQKDDSGAPSGPLPPYLQEEHYDQIRDRASRVEVLNRSITEYLAEQEPNSKNCYVLLDAQDWMTDHQLNELWSEIDRTAADGARVIFRTAAEPDLLPGRVGGDILANWTYAEYDSKRWTTRDRSSIYGGFHLYRRSA